MGWVVAFASLWKGRSAHLMSIMRVRALMQLTSGCHALLTEAGLSGPASCATSVDAAFAEPRLLAMSRVEASDCPHFRYIRAKYSNLLQDAESYMRLYMWHHDQNDVSHSAWS